MPFGRFKISFAYVLGIFLNFPTKTLCVYVSTHISEIFAGVFLFTLLHYIWLTEYIPAYIYNSKQEVSA